MPTSLESLQYYCPSGTAEGEKHILREIFVQPDDFTRLLVPPPSNPRLLVGKKGTGKTFLVDFANELFTRAGIPCCSVEPSSLGLAQLGPQPSSAEIKGGAFAALVCAVAVALGKRLRGLVGASEVQLIDEAVAQGLRTPDQISRLARLLPKVASAFIDFDFSQLLTHSSRPDANSLRAAVRQALSTTHGSVFVFLDDTDQVAAPDVPSQLNRIWGAILAARQLAEVDPKIRCVITLREEVWSRLQTADSGQRDQVDHFYRLVENLSPDARLMKRIVRRRLDLAQSRAGLSLKVDPYELFFHGKFPHMPGSEAVSSWEDLIVTRSRNRPRDAIQLLGSLADLALREGKQVITEKEFERAIPLYSESRVDLLQTENEQECPKLREVIRTFAPQSLYSAGSFKMPTSAALDHLKTAPSSFSLRLRSTVLRPGDEDDALALLDYLFKLGFLNARIADKTMPDGYGHIDPIRDPRLVDRSRLNELQNVTWEVHPAYRDFLLREQRAPLAQRR